MLYAGVCSATRSGRQTVQGRCPLSDPVMKDCFAAFLWFGFGLASVFAGSKHSPDSRFPSYEGRVMAGYQGWFRAEGDGSGEGWSHYGERRPLTASSLRPDFWPDVSGYEKTYPTVLDK